MDEFITIAHKLPSFSVTNHSDFIKFNERTVIITEGKVTTPVPEICPMCGSPIHLHAHEKISLKDIRIFDKEHRIDVTYKRVRCINCKFEAKQDIPFKLQGHRITKRLAREILRQKKNVVSTKYLSKNYGVDPHIIKEIDKRYLQHKYSNMVIERARYIAVDEISIHHNHRYATVVINLETGHVLFCEAGKKGEQVLHFLQKMGKKWLKGVKAVSMDMNAPYAAAFREHAPHIDIVYDFFHMVKLYNETVLTAIRRRLQNEAEDKKDKTTYSSLKGGRYLLVSKMSKLKEKDDQARKNNKYINSFTKRGLSVPPGYRLMKSNNQRALKNLLDMNSDLSKAYILGEQFRFAYQCDDLDAMKDGLSQWCSFAENSKIPELMKYSKTIRQKIDGIVNHAKHNINSGRLEGFNNLAKVIKRTAYGYVDDEYYFLRLMEISRYNNRFKSPRNLH